MTHQLHQAFGRELVAQRQAEFEAAARRGSLLRQLKRAKRDNDRAEAAAGRGAPARQRTPQPARACCTADLG